MHLYFDEIKRVFRQFGWKSVLSALLGGFTFSTLAIVPPAIITIELAMIYLHFINLFVSIGIVLFAIYFTLMTHFTILALRLKNKDADIDYRFLFLVNSVVMALLSVIVGLVFMIFFIHIWR